MKIKLLFLITIASLGAILGACGRLPKVPDNYDEINKTSSELEFLIECENALEDNVIEIDGGFNGISSFVADTVIRHISSGRISLDVENYDMDISMEISFEDELEFFYGRFEYSVLHENSYYIDNVREAFVELNFDKDVTYHPIIYTASGDAFIYVDYTENSITVNFCETPFTLRNSEEILFNITGRIVKHF